MKKNNKKGFTLAELLIVVAIIAVQVAISIPIFTSQLEKAREATDVANIRDYYAEISVGLLDGSLNSTTTTMTVSGEKTATATVDATTGKITSVNVADVVFKQTVSANWAIGAPEVAGVTVSDVPTGTKAVVYTFSEDASGHTYLDTIKFE